MSSNLAGFENLTPTPSLEIGAGDSFNQPAFPFYPVDPDQGSSDYHFGFSGYSGSSGYSGISGYSGSGISGYSGSGISGYSGSGISGYSGFSGFSGIGVS